MSFKLLIFIKVTLKLISVNTKISSKTNSGDILISTSLFLVLVLTVTHSSVGKAPIFERGCMVWPQVAAGGTLWRCPLDERRAMTGAGGVAPPTDCTSLNE